MPPLSLRALRATADQWVRGYMSRFGGGIRPPREREEHAGEPPVELPSGLLSAENLCVARKASPSASTVPAREHPAFAPGALVIVSLNNPREKFWGMILALAPEGLSLSGAELASFEDLAVMVKEGEPFSPAVVFFPMHRIERVELDLPDGSLPSLSQRFFSKTGLDPAAALAPRVQQAALGSQLRAAEERA